MVRVPGLIIIVLVFCVSWAGASEVVEVPVTGLDGIYEYPAHLTRTGDFTLDRIPRDVYQVSLRISAHNNSGTALCPPDSEFPLSSSLHSSIQDPINNALWYQSESMSNNDIDITLLFILEKSDGSEASWEFMQQGQGEINIWFNLNSLLPGCMIIDFPKVTIYGVTLIIDADWELGIEGATWGRIKALAGR